MKKFLQLFVLTLVFSVIATVSYADVIRRIEVVGAQRIEPKTILSYLTVKPGDDFSTEGLDESLKALYDTGLFADIQLGKDVRTLVVKVVENPIINEIAFEGNLRVEDPKLRPEIRLSPRSVFTKAKAQADVERIQEVYRRSGRFATKVEPKIILLDQNRVNLVFEIDEGTKTKIQRISFVNNKHFSDKQLKDVIISAEERWYRFLNSNDTYDSDRTEFDKELLRRFYLENGYVDFVVTSSVAELAQDRSGFLLTFTVDEGQRYRFGQVNVVNRLTGVKVTGFEEHISTEPGEWYDSTLVEKTIDELTEAVEKQFLPFVSVVKEESINVELGTVDMRFIIREAPRVFVDKINISGNVRTLDRVIRREFELAEGDPMNRDRLRQSETNIRDLGFFNKVDIQQSPGSAPDKVDVDVKVGEQSTGELSIGAGFSTADGPLADFRITERNFLGRGQEVSLATVLAGEKSEIDLGFVEPYFLGRDIRTSANIFHVTRDLQEESSYDQKRTGTNLSVGYPLSSNLRHSLGYRIVNNEISDVGADASRYIREQAGERVTSAVNHSLVYDTTNSKVRPTEGYVLRLFNEVAGLGGDAKFFNTELGGSYFYSLEDDWILNFSGKAGYIKEYGDDEVAINDRYFLGDSSFRGFEAAGIGPRDTSTGDSLGGNQYYKASVELTFPLGMPEEYGIVGHTFSDVGALWNTPDAAGVIEDDNKIRISAGVGVSWDSPIGPLRVNLAWPIQDEEYDKDQVLNFTFGTKF